MRLHELVTRSESLGRIRRARVRSLSIRTHQPEGSTDLNTRRASSKSASNRDGAIRSVTRGKIPFRKVAPRERPRVCRLDNLETRRTPRRSSPLAARIELYNAQWLRCARSVMMHLIPRDYG